MLCCTWQRGLVKITESSIFGYEVYIDWFFFFKKKNLRGIITFSFEIMEGFIALPRFFYFILFIQQCHGKSENEKNCNNITVLLRPLIFTYIILIWFFCSSLKEFLTNLIIMTSYFTFLVVVLLLGSWDRKSVV